LEVVMVVYPLGKGKAERTEIAIRNCHCGAQAQRANPEIPT
jgi:hypothetical protein